MRAALLVTGSYAGAPLRFGHNFRKLAADSLHLHGEGATLRGGPATFVRFVRVAAPGEHRGLRPCDGEVCCRPVTAVPAEIEPMPRVLGTSAPKFPNRRLSPHIRAHC